MSKIEWTDETLNLSGGCIKADETCKNCYAEKLWPRVKHTYDNKPFNVLQLRPDRLEKPLHWKTPRKIFINSMSDLFHPDMPEDFLLKAFEVFLMADWHIFQLLTKRPERMLEFIRKHGLEPLPKHLWFGISAGTQEWLNKRIEFLLNLECAVRFLSLEPLLGPISLKEANPCEGCLGKGYVEFACATEDCIECRNNDHALDGHGIGKGIHQVIVGCESGYHRRPMNIQWPLSLAEECRDAGIAFFMKQIYGEKKKLSFSEFPKELQIREFPEC